VRGPVNQLLHGPQADRNMQDRGAEVLHEASRTPMQRPARP
jgi:hypothetical protein